MLDRVILAIVPPLSSICELIGILIVAITVFKAFCSYLKGLLRKSASDAKYELANGLATSLSFKMASEVLKTVIVTKWSEFLLLGAIIILRGMMATVLFYEMKHNLPLEGAGAKQFDSL